MSYATEQNKMLPLNFAYFLHDAQLERTLIKQVLKITLEIIILIRSLCQVA